MCFLYASSFVYILALAGMSISGVTDLNDTPLYSGIVVPVKYTRLGVIIISIVSPILILYQSSSGLYLLTNTLSVLSRKIKQIDSPLVKVLAT